MASIATTLGLLWLVSLMNTAAVISPFGSALVAVGANARLVMAMTRTRLILDLFARLSRFGVPFNALLLNLVLGWLTVLVLPFTEMVAAHSSLVVFSFILGSVAVVALRRLAPDYRRPFKLPFVRFIGCVTFILATLIVYWSGWDTIRIIGIALLIGAILLALRLRQVPRHMLNLRCAAWLLPYCIDIGVISWFGSLGLLKNGWDIATYVVFGGLTFFVAVRSVLTQAEFEDQAEQILAQLGYDKDVLHSLEL